MSKKEIGLVLAVVLLGGIYIRYFTNFLQKPTIQIMAQNRPMPPINSRHGARNQRAKENAPEPSAIDPVSFAFDRRYELTSIKVVEDREYQTNKYAHCLWHLVSDSNSVSCKGIIYGMKIKGMEPDVPKARPEPLQPDKAYRLLLEAGGLKGETVFKTHPSARSTAQ